MSSGVEKLGRGPFDKAILAGFAAHKSAEEVSASEPIFGALSPVQCLDRLNKLIASKDILDAAMLAKLNLEDAYFLRNKLRAQMEKTDYIDKDSAGAYIKSIDAVQTRIERSTKGFEDQMIRMQEMHARIMAKAIEVAFQQAATELSQQYNVPLEASFKVLEEALPLAMTSLEEEVA